MSTCCCLKQPTCRNRCHLANKYEDIVNLQGAEAYIVAAARLQLVLFHDDDDDDDDDDNDGTWFPMQ